LDKVLNYTGWKRRSLLLLLGVFSALAQPPVYLLPLLIPSFSGLLLLSLNAKSNREAFFDGWWWGLGCFTAGLYWICISLYVEPEKFAWLTPFALFGLPAILGIYTGLVTLALKHARQMPSALLPAIFAGLFVAEEVARAHLFSGFPWNLTGYVWTVSDVTLQPAYLVSVYGLSFITIYAASAPALFVLGKHPLVPNALAVLLLVSMSLYGWDRLDHNPTQYTDIKVRIVQPDIVQTIKWNPQASLDILKKHIALTRSPGIETIRLVIWPEAAIPYYVEPNSVLLRDIGAILPEHTLLITGGLRKNGDIRDRKAWNSLFVINHNGILMATYDKHHLVPFGEFIPFRNILPVENISGGHGDFAKGRGPATVAVDDISPFSPLICYEAIFPDETTDGTGRTKWLLNVTNDAWFGRSSGPYQHLQMARTRAVETGLPLVRAANTGISAVIDPYGRIVKELPLNETGIVDFYLPLPNS